MLGFDAVEDYRRTIDTAKLRLNSTRTAVAEHAYVAFNSTEWALDEAHKYLSSRSLSSRTEREMHNYMKAIVGRYPRIGWINIKDRTSITVADSLYSNQPMIKEIRSLGNHYVLVAKPADHKLLMEWVNELRLLNEVMHMEYGDRKGKTHVYEWVNGVSLNGNKDAPLVNYVEYWMKDGEKPLNQHIPDCVMLYYPLS